MDPLIIVALITGGYGVIGAVLKIVEKYFPGKAPPAPLAASRPTGNEVDRGQRIDEKIDKYLDRLENDAQRDRERHEEDLARVKQEHEEKMASLKAEHEELQRLYLEAIERLESQDVALKHREPEA